MAVPTWLGCDLVTGQIIEELPDLRPEGGALSHMLGTYTSASFSLPIPLGGHGKPPRDWLRATEPGRTMIVCVLNGRPVWGGLVLFRRRGTAATARLSCVTPEGYLDRRYVGDHLWIDEDEASMIAAGLVNDAQAEGINLTVDAPPTGTLRNRQYYDTDDKTVYSALRELMGVINGPEWTITLDWTDSTRTAVAKIFRVRKRIGVQSATPSAVFSTGATDAVYEYTEDYTSERGANHIVATSSGEGVLRPQSTPARDEALFAVGWPRYERRFTPSTSITVIDTLNQHAQRSLELMGRGARILKITARADASPRLGRDWNTGDDVGYELVGHGHPEGLSGVARVIGWELDPATAIVTPILLQPGSEIVP